MVIKVKRIYEPAVRADGSRIFVDRLWPRGISKARARVTLWAKDFAPSNELRSWFHEDPEKRLAVFQRKYRAELKLKRTALRIALRSHKKPFTLVTAVKDFKKSHIPVIRAVISRG